MLRVTAMLALCLSSVGAYYQGRTDAAPEAITRAVIVPLSEPFHDVRNDCELTIGGLHVRMGTVATIRSASDHFVELTGGLGNFRLTSGDSLDVECREGRLYTSLFIRQAPLPKKPKRQVIRGIGGL